MESKVSKTIESLKKNGMEGKYFETSKEAVEYILSQVPGEASVGIGGSMTVNSIGIVDKLKERGNTVFFHWLVKDKAESTKVRRQAFGADVYMCSSNALTMDGKLINIDATGNRVAGMFYGPPKVYVICGVNKIAEDVDRGFERIRENVYKNAERLKLNTPCVKTKHCTDCSAPDRMCNVKVIIERKPSFTDIEVIIINEELGF